MFNVREVPFLAVNERRSVLSRRRRAPRMSIAKRIEKRAIIPAVLRGIWEILWTGRKRRQEGQRQQSRHELRFPRILRWKHCRLMRPLTMREKVVRFHVQRFPREPQGRSGTGERIRALL